MNERIVSKGILLLMGLATIFSLIGCSSTKKDSELKFLEYRVSGYNPGYDIKIENGKLTYENFDEGKKGKNKVNEETISELLKLFKRLDIYSWDGYKGYDEDTLDGIGFTLYVQFADGTSINASGENVFPNNYSAFDKAMRLLMENKSPILEEATEEPICGGVTDNTDYNAPKEIKSDKLVSLSVGFYHDFKYDTGNGMFYTFYLEPNEDGTLILKDNSVAEGFEVDSSVLDGAQKIIKENDLAASNGINKTTAGLPPEYQPCFVEARYDSGEYISFSTNSDPTSAWGSDFVDYFGRIMAENGDDKYLASKLSGSIKRFWLETLSNNILYTYDTVNVPANNSTHNPEDVNNDVDSNEYEEYLNRRIYDMVNDELIEDTIAERSSEYYEGLMQILDENEIRDFENPYTASDLVDYDNPTDYYDFYIEFEDGNIISGAAVDPGVLESFKPLEEQLLNYMNEYIDLHKMD